MRETILPHVKTLLHHLLCNTTTQMLLLLQRQCDAPDHQPVFMCVCVCVCVYVCVCVCVSVCVCVCVLDNVFEFVYFMK